MKRWICPECQNGLNAPERMRRNDSRRFCLTCSAKSPLLVERKCPVLDARRLRKSAALTHHKHRAKAKRSQLPYRERDDLIQKDYQRFIRLKCWPALRYFAGPLSIRRSRFKHCTTGCCWSSGDICVTLAIKSPRSEILVVLLHELAHAASPGREHHGDEWHSLFVESVREVFGELNYEGVNDYVSLHNRILRAVTEQEKQNERQVR